MVSGGLGRRRPSRSWFIEIERGLCDARDFDVAEGHHQLHRETGSITTQVAGSSRVFVDPRWKHGATSFQVNRRQHGTSFSSESVQGSQFCFCSVLSSTTHFVPGPEACLSGHSRLSACGTAYKHSNRCHAACRVSSVACREASSPLRANYSAVFAVFNCSTAVAYALLA